MEFESIKLIHVSTVVISLSLFVLRFAGVILNLQRIIQAKVLKFLPHIVDTILLVSAITLAVKLGLKPGENPWILAKIIALIAYIIAGSYAIKRGKTRQVKIVSGIIALVIFGYIISVAVTKSILGFLA